MIISIEGLDCRFLRFFFKYVEYSHSQTHKIFFYFHEYQYSTAHDKDIFYGIGAVIVFDISS